MKFNCRDQFMVMSFAQFTDRAGLRDITQSGRSSSRGRTSGIFLISRQSPLVFRRRVLSYNLLYGKISPDSSVFSSY
ncbi:DUF4372 domain-containing protein [Bacteroides caecigallinarum]|nr:DUF4372 domain-containing protein [Bacteroides caecigallinarum]